MTGKILIFGATGAVGSSLAKLLNSNSIKTHLIGKDEGEVSKLSEETNGSYSVADVTDSSFIEKIDADFKSSFDNMQKEAKDLASVFSTSMGELGDFMDIEADFAFFAHFN